MEPHALRCPQCLAPLAPGRFARSVVCPFCGSTVMLDDKAVDSARFKSAFAAWNAPENYGFSSWVSVGDSHWALGALVASGEISDVYAVERARWPTERALVKILRVGRDAAQLDHEWEVLTALQASSTPGAPSFLARIPQPILRGTLTAGTGTGSRAIFLRWASGYIHTFEAVAGAFPKGIEPRASIWVWRRILEILTFLHASGIVHGAVLPPHLLVEEGEHGVRLVGFRAAGRMGTALAAVSPGFERFYPESLLESRRLTPGADVAMSARAVAALLGGDPQTGAVPAAVPAPLAEEIRRICTLDPAAPAAPDAWSLRERLGSLAGQVYGPPLFCPIEMPD
jgi:hypothetical protein